MLQTRRGSLYEASINTLIGLAVSFLAWPIAAAMFGVEYTTSQHFAMTGFFTAVSVARSYVVRRWFNAAIHRAAQRMAGGGDA